jgi:type I restriction enzyme S subunit
MRASYPTYKSTSIPWMPEMPEHWDLIGLNLLFRDNKNKNKGMVESLVLSLSYGNIIRKQREENFGLIPESFETYQILEPGYIVLRLTDLQNDKRSLRVGYVKERGIITSAYTGLIPGKVDSKYYYYLLHYLDIRKHFYSLGGGVRQSSDYNEIKKTKVPFPPLTEQTAIAYYLDAKAEQINRFIEKKQKLIALLKEQKQAVINELLEDREGKWERRKLKFFGKVKTGRTPSIEKSKEDFFSNGDINWFTPGDFGDCLIIDNSERKLNKIAIEYKEIDLFSENSIYLIGIGGTLGKVALSPKRASANQQINVITVNEKFVTPKFLLFYLLTRRKILLETADFTTLPILNQSKTKSIEVPCPHLETQKEIVFQIEKEFAAIDAAISKIETEIDKVKELKQSLIAEVVTGRIKVA